MFDRAGLKTAAKMRVTQNRWMAVLVCLVAGFCGVFGGGSGLSLNLDDFTTFFTEPSYSSPSYNIHIYDFTKTISWLIVLAVAVFVGIVIACAIEFLIVNIIRVGFCGWFLRYSRGEDPHFGEMFSCFHHFKNTMLGMLLRNVYIFLWTLLLIIPGIIKSYSYAMVPFILYENPSLSAKQALVLSETMMDGWKWELFKFDFSFIGWFVLDLFTFGLLGLFFINPYYYTAFSMMYDNIKYDAVYTRGVIDASLLNMPQYPYTAEAEVVE